MNQRLFTATTVACIPALLALSSPREEIRFAATEGLTLKKSFESTGELTIESSEVLLNGNPFPAAPEIEMEASNSSLIEVVDTYVTVDDGGILRLARRFETIADESEVLTSNPMTGEVTVASKGASELEGQTVVFAWNSDAGDYDCEYEQGSEGDEALLADLVQDMDLLGFLPVGEPAVGDTWNIDPEALRHILLPGGDLKLVSESDVGGMIGSVADEPGMSMSDLLGELSGEVTAQLTSVRSEDRVAVITVQLEIDSTNDLTEQTRAALEDMPPVPGMGSMELESVDVEMAMDGEGLLLWSLDAGHFVEFSLDAEILSTTDMAMSIEGPEQRVSMQQAMTMAISRSFNYSAEAY